MVNANYFLKKKLLLAVTKRKVSVFAYFNDLRES